MLRGDRLRPSNAWRLRVLKIIWDIKIRERFACSSNTIRHKRDNEINHIKKPFEVMIFDDIIKYCINAI